MIFKYNCLHILYIKYFQTQIRLILSFLMMSCLRDIFVRKRSFYIKKVCLIIYYKAFYLNHYFANSLYGIDFFEPKNTKIWEFQRQLSQFFKCVLQVAIVLTDKISDYSFTIPDENAFEGTIIFQTNLLIKNNLSIAPRYNINQIFENLNWTALLRQMRMVTELVYLGLIFLH